MTCKRGHDSPRNKGGTCIECARLAARKWREDHREEHNAYQQIYSGKNLKLLKKYLKDPKEIWFDHRTRKRKQLKDATPGWVDKEGIRRFYEECVRLSEQMGVDFEVDHEIPLKGKYVSGLHIPENLKVISHNLNKTKGNKFNSKKESEELLRKLRTNDY